MTVVRLIGLIHGQWDDIKESIGPGNRVTLEHDKAWDRPEGNAYRAKYGGCAIGYIPLVPTLRKFYKEAHSDVERHKHTEWGRATVKVREWLDSRVKYNHEESWSIPVWGILYHDENGYNTKDRGEPRQICLAFEEVE